MAYLQYNMAADNKYLVRETKHCHILLGQKSQQNSQNSHSNNTVKASIFVGGIKFYFFCEQEISMKLKLQLNFNLIKT